MVHDCSFISCVHRWKSDILIIPATIIQGMQTRHSFTLLHASTWDTFCLGMVLDRNTKKVEAIDALKSPTNIKTLRGFLGIVQYYQDLWENQSDILATLTDLVGKCSVTKSTKNKPVLRKKPGIGAKFAKMHLKRYNK